MCVCVYVYMCICVSLYVYIYSLADGTIKKKGTSYKLDESQAQASAQATQTLIGSSASAQVDTFPAAPPSSPLTVVSSAAPNAPRKNSKAVNAKGDVPTGTEAVGAGSTFLSDDIEESFNDDQERDEGKSGRGKSASMRTKQLTLSKGHGSSAALNTLNTLSETAVALLPAALLPVESASRKRSMQVCAVCAVCDVSMS
jgi:hypothetical protein